ncbi:MAG: cellulose biosynthesis (CelD)-like protein [Solirubrobacterales bacterium]|jgi:CelD/BcsL family acetyltransferase involved in cellulose biosynthesis|nr:cellulose biosynthesis (CelD)-like protein [Solirubrobacterales bacterium]
MASVEVIEDVSAAQALAPAWDELAVACSLPLCSPGWMLAWWKHLAPSGGQLRIIAVRDGSQLVALAPWFVQSGESGRTDMRFLGAEMSDRVDVLCRPGSEPAAARALRETLAAIEPRPDLVAFEAVPVSSAWTRRLAGGVSGRLRFARYRNSAYPAPAVDLPSGTPEEWLAGRSSNFRGQMGRLRRRLEKQGGTVRQIRDASEVPGALTTLLALHASRWEGRAESGLVKPGVSELLGEAATALGPDRLRLWAAEIDGELISVQLFLAAGTEVKYWNGGWSEDHADVKPSMLTILAALEEAISRGEKRLDLGVGTHAYKLRFANSEDTLTWGGVIVRNRRWPRTRAEMAPRVLRYRAKLLARSLPAPVISRVEAIVKGRRGRE